MGDFDALPAANDADVPTAYYGKSHVGRMKYVYREGLRNRYGALMQAISGVHFNYSFASQFWEVYAAVREQGAGVSADFRSASYFDLVRNYRRLGWIVLYLFGTSPVVGRDFLGDSTAGLERLDARTAYGPYATSLRMSDIGYRNRNQAGVAVSVNSLDEYLRDLRRAVTTPHPAFEKIGVKRGDTWMQLFHQRAADRERVLQPDTSQARSEIGAKARSSALRRGGVEYIEMRALDVSAFDPVGVNQTKLRFLEAFAALCLLKTSLPIGNSEQEAIDDNFLKAARRGARAGPESGA